MIKQRNKVLWTDESTFEITGSNRSVCIQKSDIERLVTPYSIPSVKHGGGSIRQSRRFALGEGQTESDQLSLHTAIPHDPIWNAAYGSRIYTRVR